VCIECKCGSYGPIGMQPCHLALIDYGNYWKVVYGSMLLSKPFHENPSFNDICRLFTVISEPYYNTVRGEVIEDAICNLFDITKSLRSFFKDDETDYFILAKARAMHERITSKPSSCTMDMC
jgi:hypothetical protein